MQRASGTARIRQKSGGAFGTLDRLYQEGAAKVRFPRPEPGAPPEAVLINTAGGLTGGDRFAYEIKLGAGCRLTATTQACEKVYRSLGADAELAVRLGAGPGARIDWVPQETILFHGGRLVRRVEADLAADAVLLAVEAAIFGRTAMGEAVAAGRFRDRWRIRRDGRLIFADELHFDWADARLLARPAVLAGQAAMATLLLAAPDADRKLDSLRAILGAAGGASAWDGKLLARIAAPDGQALRRTLVPAISHLLAGAPLPRVWQI
jgi:urease accessory protein